MNKKIIEAIIKARENGFSDEHILQEIEAQNPDKKPFFDSAREKKANSTEILNELIRQNSFSQEEVIENTEENDQEIDNNDTRSINKEKIDSIFGLSKKFVMGLIVFSIISIFFGIVAWFILQEPEPDDFDDKVACEEHGFYFYNNKCHFDVATPDDFDNKEMCEEHGFYFFEENCHDHPNPTEFTTQEECEEAGLYWYWWSCHSTPAQ